MEKSFIKEPNICNGNVMFNGFHEADLPSDELQEAQISDTLVFYVNGKQVYKTNFS